jgi:hypothetical protein
MVPALEPMAKSCYQTWVLQRETLMQRMTPPTGLVEVYVS